MSAILIVMSFVITGAMNGGAHSSLLQIPMPSMAVCEAAAEKIERAGPVITQHPRSYSRRSVEAVCVRAE